VITEKKGFITLELGIILAPFDALPTTNETTKNKKKALGFL
jgi:hypothetical protein